MRLTTSNVGKQISRLRQAKGLTQTELSKMVGLSQVYISEIERGIKIPSFITALAIFNALGQKLEVKPQDYED